MKGLLIAFVVSGALATQENRCPQQNTEAIKVTTQASGIELKTMEHDKHLFVVGRAPSYNGGVSIIHHPGCPCLKAERTTNSQ